MPLTTSGFRRLLALTVVAITVLAAPGVSAKKKDKSGGVSFSGFLGSYADLKRVDEFSDFLWGYTKRPLILRDYHKAILDPILVYFHPEARGVGIDPAKLSELTDFFRDRIVEEMSGVSSVELTDKPGPGVMRVRIALTDIRGVKSGANIGAKVVGAAAGVGFLVPAVDVGGATMECEVLDAVSGERLVALVDTDSGRRMFNFKSMKSMGDAKAAMREWAKDFRRNLERIHEGRLPKKLEKAQP